MQKLEIQYRVALGDLIDKLLTEGFDREQINDIIDNSNAVEALVRYREFQDGV